MKRIVLFKIGSREAQLPKTVGAFLIIIAVLMLIHSGAVMFDSWQAVRGFDECVIDAYKAAEIVNVDNGIGKLIYEMKVGECKNSLYQITGAQVPGGVYNMSIRQASTALLGPVSVFFGWAIVFLFALFLFNSATIVVPVEELEIPLGKTKSKKRK